MKLYSPKLKQWKDGSIRYGRRKVIALSFGFKSPLYAYTKTGRLVVEPYAPKRS